MKRVHLIIGSLALVALLGITMVSRSVEAQDTAPPETPGASSVLTDDKESARDTYLATLAENLGVTTEQLETALSETSDELDIGGWMQGRIGSRDSHRDGFGSRRGAGHFFGRGHIGSILRNIDLTPAADFLGITEDQLIDELRDGNRFIEIAAEHGKTSDDVRAFLIQRATVAIDEYLQNAEASPATDSAATETATA